MPFLVDAQLPPAPVDWLRTRGHDAVHVATVMPGQTPDRDIARYAAANDLALITKDEDFLTRHPPIDYRLVWIRLGNASNRALIAWLEPRFDQIVTALDAGETMVEVR